MDGHSSASLLVELGAIIFALSVLSRIANAVGFSPIPLYLLAGLAFGRGGIYPLATTEGFVEVAGQVGAILLLLMLGLEYTAEEFRASVTEAAPAGLLDLVLNFIPGVVAGLLLGWSPVASVFLGGITYTSSSGVIAKVLADLGRLGNRETPVVLSIAVIEDLVMAVYLPLVAVLAVGGDVLTSAVTLFIALGAALGILVIALYFGEPISRVLYSRSDEVLLLTVLGVTLVVAGAAEHLQVSAAVAAFLVGIGLSGRVADQARALLVPLRDLFAAVFFVLFGLRLDPGALAGVAVVALALAGVTGLTKFATGWLAAARAGIGPKGRQRAGATLIARGEFSILVAGLAVTTGVEPRIGALAAAYVLILAVVGPPLTRLIGHAPRVASQHSAGEYPGPA